jgi:hypothetical protein
MAKPNLEDGLEFHPDAWKRFERAAGVVAKSPPQHRLSKKAAPVKKTRAIKAKKEKGA